MFGDIRLLASASRETGVFHAPERFSLVQLGKAHGS